MMRAPGAHLVGQGDTKPRGGEVEAQRGPSQGPESGLDLTGQPWHLLGAGVQSGPG